jgi:hypothetical protein
MQKLVSGFVYVGGDAAKIKELQCKLNSLGISGQNGRLKEGGV